MRVKHAAQVISKTMANYIKYLLDLPCKDDYIIFY